MRTACPAGQAAVRYARTLAALAVFAWLGVTSASTAAASTVEIDIHNYAFTPADVTVAPGTTVVWVNHDETPHTIASTDHGLASKALDTDDRYSFIFEKEGDYRYFCTLHPYMGGVVKVRSP